MILKPALLNNLFSRRFTDIPRVYLGLFLLAFFLRFLVLGGLLSYGGERELVLGDTTRYLSLAQSVLHGAGFSYENAVESYRPPGYPAYLMLFLYLGIPLWIAALVQILFASLIPVAVYWGAIRYLRAPPSVGLLAGFLAAIEPVQVFYSVVLMPDVFFAVGFLGAIYFLLRYVDSGRIEHTIFAGVLLGAANYFRPAGLYAAVAFAVALLGVLFMRRTFSLKGAVHTALFISTVVLVMFPWSIRNHRMFGSYAFVSSDAYVLYAYGAAQSIAVDAGRVYEEVKQELLRKLVAEAPDGAHPTSLRNRAWLFEQSKEAIRAHPVAYAKGYLLGVNTLFFSGNYHYLLARYKLVTMPTNVVSFSLVLAKDGVGGLTRAIAERITQPYTSIAILGKVFWFVVILLSLIGAWRLRREPLTVFFVVSVLYFAATILATTIGIEARHRYALNPLIFIFASSVIYLGYEKMFRRHSQ